MTSPRLAESPKRDSKPLNVKFNQLRGSQSLPDLSQEEKSENSDHSKTTSSANQNVPPISSAQSPEKSSNRTHSENKTSPESNHSLSGRLTDQSESSPSTDRQNEDISDEIVFTPHEHESANADQPTDNTLVATETGSTSQGMVFIKVPEGIVLQILPSFKYLKIIITENNNK